MTQTGVYVGTDPKDFASYSRWMGTTPSNVLNYLNNDSWKGFDSSVPWQVGLWKDTAPGHIWSVPLTVWGTSLEQVATGAYNDHFLKAAQGLAQTKASSDGNMYVRVGWEFNGDWMPWAAKGHEGAFIKAFQELVTTFRSVSDKFKFVWDTTNDGGTMNPETAYPGDKYVNVIGTDVYYSTKWDGMDAAKGFRGEVTRPYGLQWQQDFAAAHGKETAISEWGVASDNAGPYVQAMTKWMADHNMVYENYWDSNGGGYSGKLSTGANASAGAVYKDAIANLAAIADTTPSVVSSFVPDQTAYNVARLYYGIFDRSPEAAGLQIWTNSVKSGSSIHDVASAFLGSAEYKFATTGMSDDKFVYTMYNEILGRSGDAGGIQNWNNYLDHGGARVTVINSFTDSLEFQSKYLGQSSVAYVEQLYDQVLGRKVETSGLQGWADALNNDVMTRTDVAHAITSSAEFQAKYVGPSNSAFVDALYENALGRHADADGLQIWTDALVHGTSRANVAVAIAESSEAQNHLVSVIEHSWQLA